MSFCNYEPVCKDVTMSPSFVNAFLDAVCNLNKLEQVGEELQANLMVCRDESWPFVNDDWLAIALHLVEGEYQIYVFAYRSCSRSWVPEQELQKVLLPILLSLERK